MSKKPNRCQFNEGRPGHCPEFPTRKWGLHWFCEEHGSRSGKYVSTPEPPAPSVEARIYEEAVATWGEESQMLMCMEELAELTQALSHKMRGREHNVEEEIADVEIMLAQMKLIVDPEAVADIKITKLARLACLLGEAQS